MNGKKGAAAVGRLHAANKTMTVNSHILSIRGKRHVVKIDLERWGDIFGGLLLGASILALSIIIPILFGGY